MLRFWKYFSYCFLLFLWLFSLTSIFQFQPNLAKHCQPGLVEIYSAEKQLMQSTHTVSQTGFSVYTKLKDFPDYLIKLLIATEDKRFFYHPGIDPMAMARSFWYNIKQKKIVTGASTITQQLARILYGRQMSNNRFWRKWQEVLWAINISLHTDKSTVLECYVNRVPMPWFRNGLPALSQALFKKDVSFLSKEESAILVLLIGHNLRNMRQLEIRKQNLSILHGKDLAGLSLRRGLVNDEHFLLKGQDLHFAQWLLHRYASLSGKVFTPIHYDLQGDVAAIIKNELAALKKFNVRNAAVVVLEWVTDPLMNKTFSENKNSKNKKLVLRSLIGSENFFHEQWGQVNGAAALRDAGSTLKPFVYGLAFDKLQIRPYHLIRDEDVSFNISDGQYRASNSDQMHWGKITLHESLANSRNIPVLKLVDRLGVPTVYDYFKKIGFDHLTESSSYYGPGLVLGIGGVSLLHLAQLYASLANEGNLSPVLLGKNNNTELFWGVSGKTMTLASAYYITDILSDQDSRRTLFGSRNFLDFPFDVAVKTGTSKDHRDSWSVGYTGQFVVAVWVGNFTGEKTKEVSGYFGAGRILHQVFRRLVNNRHEFVYPKDWQKVNLCRNSGALVENNCPSIAMRIPEREIALLGQNQENQPQIISPIAGEKFYIERRQDLIKSSIPVIISVPQSENFFYQIDDQAIKPIVETENKFLISLSKGKHSIKLYHKSVLKIEHFFFVY